MRRFLLTAFFGLILGTSGFSQVVTVFSENFDTPSGPDSVTTYNTNTLLTSAWNDTTNLQVSPQHSYHTQIVPFDSVIFETNTFSTVGNIFVRLKFDQIAKIHFGQRGYVQASNDGGTTWTTLTGSMYQGQSPQFNTVGYFNELSYPAASLTPYWGGLSTSTPTVPPTNQWWAAETFNLSTILGGVNGYANCKIRFIASHQLNTPVNPSGWYIDNLLVEAAPCELEPPTFTYNLTPPRKPVGARYQASEQVRVKARDFGGMNEGMDSVILHYRFNNGPWVDTLMTASTGGSCPDSSVYSFTFTGMIVGDTIDWYIEMFDCACPNMTRDPAASASPDYYTFWRDPSPPAICGAATPGSFPLVVQAFPYVEDFESGKWQPGTGNGDNGTAHRGVFATGNPTPTGGGGDNWTVQPAPGQTGFAWSVRTGSTGTNNTGPNGNNTTNGSRYVYTEASQGNGTPPNRKFTQLITPCIDLTQSSCAALEFYYHMYGSDMDRLRIDVDTGDATSSYVNNILRLDGQQNPNSSSSWNKAFVSLEQFSGKIIRIRFLGRKSTPVNGDKNDISIDDIRILEPTPVDVEMSSYLEPENGFCSYSNAEVVKASLQSLGCQTLTAIPVACRIEFTPASGGPTTNTIIRDTLGGSYPLGSDTTFNFTPTADLSGFGTYNLYVWSEVANDTINTNDTVGPYTIEHFAPVSTFPYLLSFDDPGTTPGNGTPGNPGVVGTADWERVPDPTNGGYAWHVMEGTSPSAGTGPITDYSRKGNYMYTEGNFGTSPSSALFVSECIDLGGMTDPVLDFRYFMLGSDIGALAVQVVPSGSNSWVNPPGNIITNNATNAQTNPKQPWRHWSVDLSNYAGDVIKIRIIGQKTGPGVAADLAIDDLRIYDQLNTDVGVEHIQPPGNRIDQNAPVSPVFVLRNYGKSSVSSIPINYTITPLCGPNAGIPVSYTATFNGSIAAGASVSFPVPASAIPTYPNGDFEICASTGKAGDTYTFNDEHCRTSVGWPTFPIQTGFIEDFDACNEGTETGFWTSGDYLIFSLGTPIGGAGSAPNAYNTSNFGYNSYPGTEEFLNAPRFVGFDTIAGAQLWFKHKFNFGAGDAGQVEIFQPGGVGFIPLGFQDVDNAVGVNWYNEANVSSVNNGSAWTGPSTGLPNTAGWVTSMWPLNIYNFSANPLIVRWKLVSPAGGTSEWAIDDVEVRIPPQNSASPVFIDTEEYIALPDQDNTLRVRIQNTGAKRLDSCMISFSTNGPAGPFSAPEKIVFDQPLFQGAISGWDTLTTPWVSPASGTYNVCMVTSRPNNKQDNLTSDDTLCVTINVSDKIEFGPNDSIYCNDFDDPATVEWIALNWPDKQGLLSWEKGTPTQAPITAPHSAPNSWMTNLTNNYRQRDSSSLFTPVFALDSGQTYEISFWHNFKTELYHDGGSFEVSYDGWKTFSTVGFVLPDSSWFNTTHVTSIDILNPGWTGDSDGWEKTQIRASFEAPDTGRDAMFRFRFGSDQSFEFQGWAIDDFCLAKVSGPSDVFIGVDEEDLTDLIGVGNVVPNPTTGETMIPYVMNNPANVRVSIYSTIGQQLMNFEQTSEQGINKIKFDVSGWSPGMYIVAIEVDGQQITRKVIVQ